MLIAFLGISVVVGDIESVYSAHRCICSSMRERVCEQLVLSASGDTLADVSGRKLQDLLRKSRRRGRHPTAASSIEEIQRAAVWSLLLLARLLQGLVKNELRNCGSHWVQLASNFIAPESTRWDLVFTMQALVEALPGAHEAALGGNCGAPAKRDRDQASPEGLKIYDLDCQGFCTSSCISSCGR